VIVSEAYELLVLLVTQYTPDSTAMKTNSRFVTHISWTDECADSMQSWYWSL